MLKSFSSLIVCFFSMHILMAIDIKIAVKPVSCSNGIDGSVEIKVSNSESPYSIRLMSAKNNKLISQKSSVFDTINIFSNLGAGDYIVQLLYKGSKEDTLVSLEEPDPLNAIVIELIDFEGSGESVKSDLKLKYSGGTPPYVISWDENAKKQTGEIATGLSYGIYSCTLNDRNKCGPVSATFFLFEDEIEKFKQTNQSQNELN